MTEPRVKIAKDGGLWFDPDVMDDRPITKIGGIYWTDDEIAARVKILVNRYGADFTDALEALEV